MISWRRMLESISNLLHGWRRHVNLKTRIDENRQTVPKMRFLLGLSHVMLVWEIENVLCIRSFAVLSCPICRHANQWHNLSVEASEEESEEDWLHNMHHLMRTPTVTVHRQWWRVMISQCMYIYTVLCMMLITRVCYICPCNSIICMQINYIILHTLSPADNTTNQMLFAWINRTNTKHVKKPRHCQHC